MQRNSRYLSLLNHRTGNILLDETMPYLNHRKLRLTPEAENLQVTQ